MKLESVKEWFKQEIAHIKLMWIEYLQVMENKYWPKKIVLTIFIMCIGLALGTIMLALASLVCAIPGLLILLFLKEMSLIVITGSIFNVILTAIPLGFTSLISGFILIPLLWEWANKDDPKQL